MHFLIISCNIWLKWASFHLVLLQQWSCTILYLHMHFTWSRNGQSSKYKVYKFTHVTMWETTFLWKVVHKHMLCIVKWVWTPITTWYGYFHMEFTWYGHEVGHASPLIPPPHVIVIWLALIFFFMTTIWSKTKSSMSSYCLVQQPFTIVLSHTSKHCYP